MKNRNLIWGIFFIIAAVLIILSQTSYLIGVNIYTLTATVLLIPIIVESLLHLNFGGILFPLAFIFIMYAKPLGITNLTPWSMLLTALLGTIGLHILFGMQKKQHCYMYKNKNDDNENFETIVNSPDGEIIEYSVNFGSSIKYVNSENFKKASFRCSFGALKVYFDNAKINSNGAQINLEVSFGAVVLYFPRNWNVINNANISLSGLEEKNRRTIENDVVNVVLTGNVSLSGVEIYYI